jgi:glycosyltransferase involved in cell wall biosynthesis
MAVYLAEALGQRGHRVVFACKRNELLLDELAARAIESHALPISGKTNLAAPFLLGWLAERIGADIIHTHLSTAGLWGSFAGRIAGVPTVASVHALNVKTCYQYADMIATCSEGVRDHLLAQGMSPSNIRVLHNGVRPGDFEGLDSAANVRAELDIAPDAPVIGEVAHLSARKGHRYLIEAVALLRERGSYAC